MKPVRLKLYGLITVTRRGYIVMLLAEVALLCMLTSTWFVWMSRPEGQRGLANRVSPPILLLLNHLYWFILVLALLLALEAYFVLRRFAREEAQRGQRKNKTHSPIQPPDGKK